MRQARFINNEPAPYGIGSDHWPGVGKTVEEMSELGVELGKLQGSGGDRNHWSGDLVVAIRNEVADLKAALLFLEEANPVLTLPDDLDDNPRATIANRIRWKLDLFRSWQRNDPPEKWPQPESFGLPSRERQKRRAT